ncbi:MAG: stage IV sporulation protein A [Oscillospiraceae bacterium]|nr:stage IV sporulation protein A [Oscillospiraceae bacterium]
MAVSDVSIYKDIALRTNGDIYLGVVGPVRTGKSTFIKRFMETLVIPHIDNVYRAERVRDELPQSGSGKTIMTAEPKFIPEEAVSICLEDGAEFSVRLIDCVGYMVPGASGQFEDGSERLVTTPWFDHEITLTEAAEQGTRKVITDHSTIGLVITCDGTICDIPREAYLPAEERVIRELQSIGKPFTVLMNSADPASETAREAADAVAVKYGVTCLCVNCQELGQGDILQIMQSILYEFPVKELGFRMPSWVEALPPEHPLRAGILDAIRGRIGELEKLRDVCALRDSLNADRSDLTAAVSSMQPGLGRGCITLELPRSLYYDTISEQSGFTIRDDGDLMSLLTELKTVKGEYDRVSEALKEVRQRGYGIVAPSREELKLEEPEIVRQGGRYGVRLKASAPSIHMIMANIETEVSPALGGEKASEEIINFLLQGFEGDTSRIWESNIFGKSLYDIAGEGVMNKLRRMPANAQGKLQQTLTRIVNDGSGSLICIIL